MRTLAPLRATLFPYTTLFRSGRVEPRRLRRRADARHLRQDRAGSPDRRAALRPPAGGVRAGRSDDQRSEEHTSELQSPCNLVCRLLLEKKKNRSVRTSVIERR